MQTLLCTCWPKQLEKKHRADQSLFQSGRTLSLCRIPPPTEGRNLSPVYKGWEGGIPSFRPNFRRTQVHLETEHAKSSKEHESYWSRFIPPVGKHLTPKS